MRNDSNFVANPDGEIAKAAVRAVVEVLLDILF